MPQLCERQRWGIGLACGGARTVLSLQSQGAVSLVGETSMNPAIRASNLTKAYHLGNERVQTLNDFSLEVFPGEMVAIVGRNGSGKSTLLHTLACLQRPDSGHVVIDDVDMTELDGEELVDVRSRKVGFLFQAFNVLPDETARENVEIVLREQGLPAGQCASKAGEALHIVGLENRQGRRLRELTALQRHTVTIARALAQKPAVIFADEPTKVLDSIDGQVLMGLLQKINDEGMTMIISTPDAGLGRHCRRVVTVAEGTMEDDTLVSRRRIVPPERIPGPSHDSYIYESPSERETAEEEVCPRCNFGSPKGEKVCQRCGFTTELTEQDERSIKDRLTGTGSLGVESTSDEGAAPGEVPGQELIEQLRAVPFFAQLGSKSLVKVLPTLEERHYPKGTRIVRQGEVGDSFHMIRSGNAGVLLEKEGKPGIPIARLGPNDGFGEMALLTDETRSATVVSTTFFNRLLTQRLRTLEEKITPN